MVLISRTHYKVLRGKYKGTVRKRPKHINQSNKVWEINYTHKGNRFTVTAPTKKVAEKHAKQITAHKGKIIRIHRTQ